MLVSRVSPPPQIMSNAFLLRDISPFYFWVTGAPYHPFEADIPGGIRSLDEQVAFGKR